MLSACASASPTPDASESQASSPPSSPSMMSSGTSPAPSQGTAVPLMGMRWPEAVSRAAASGLTVVPSFAGPPGPLTPECVVVQQSPLPGETLMAPVINALVQCPTQPGPSNGANFPSPLPAPS